MGFFGSLLKKMAIKKVTKKRFNQLIGLIENDPRLHEIGNALDINKFESCAIQTLKNLIDMIEIQGCIIDVPDEITNWWELLLFLLCTVVQAELAYDPTMGSEEDINLIVNIANKELEKWKKESILKKFIRREMLYSKADKFIK